MKSKLLAISILLLITAGCIQKDTEEKRQEIQIAVWDASGWTPEKISYENISDTLKAYNIIVVQRIGNKIEDFMQKMQQEMPNYDQRRGTHPQCILFDKNCSIDYREDFSTQYPQTYDNPPVAIGFITGNTQYTIVSFETSAIRGEEEAQHIGGVLGKRNTPMIMACLFRDEYDKKKTLNDWTWIIEGKSKQTVAQQKEAYSAIICNSQAMKQYMTWGQEKLTENTEEVTLLYMAIQVKE